MTEGDLPPRPGWDWRHDYQSNVDAGHRPSQRMLLAARIPSTLFLALSVAVVFTIGRQIGGRPLAYVISGLYALHPVVLLNGRRAMMEGSLLFWGSLTVLMAIVISRKREQHGRWRRGSPPRAAQKSKRQRTWPWWLGLVLCSGRALASKHSAAIFVASAFALIFVSELSRQESRQLGKTILHLFVSGIIVFGVFVALSPALWTDPPARFLDLIEVRTTHLERLAGDEALGLVDRAISLV